MAINLTRALLKKKQHILELWMQNQLSSETLREDLISNEELRSQSEELVEGLLNNLSDTNDTDVDSEQFTPIVEILSGISITRAHQGFSPRETGLFIFGLNQCISKVLSIFTITLI